MNMKNVLKKSMILMAGMALVIPLGTSAYNNAKAKTIRPRTKRIIKKTSRKPHHIYCHHIHRTKHIKKSKKNRHAIMKRTTKYNHKMHNYYKLADETANSAPRTDSKRLFKKGFVYYCTGHRNTKARMMRNVSYNDGYYYAKELLNNLYIIRTGK